MDSIYKPIVMKIVNCKIPIMLRDKDQINVATESWVLWCGILSVAKYLPLLRRSKVIRGYILDGKKKIYFVRYGFFNDNSMYEL